jgi:hypothetical protein
MPDQLIHEMPPQEVGNWLSHRNFARCVMSDVYALLDYLSGRAAPSLLPSSHGYLPPHRHQGGPDRAANRPESGAMPCDAIEHDLAEPSALLCRAMRIGTQIDEKTADIDYADMAFLIRARDQLNVRAAPATGSSISFTIRVVERLLGKDQSNRDGVHPIRYIIPDRSLDFAALQLAEFVKSRLNYLKLALIVTVLLSTYVACGKLLLETRDAVNKDFGANLASIMAQVSAASNAQSAAGVPFVIREPGGQVPDVLINKVCETGGTSLLLDQGCHQREELMGRKKDIHDLLKLWICPFHQIGSDDEKVAQWAATETGILGNYLLPVLYGWLGALGFVLRRLNRQLADCLLTPRDLRANHIRIILGTVTGACIGLFVNSSTGAATLTGIGGAAVTLSASGIAFLAGYGVEGVFRMLDALINHVFTPTDSRQDRSHS